MKFRSLALPLIAALLAFNGVARAQDVSGCDKFKWSVARELGWFAASPQPVESGAALGLEKAYRLALAPDAAAHFLLPPEREPKPATLAALASFVIEQPGLYQITLSKEAWIDVVQNGARVKSTEFSGQKTCPGLRKSVRFALTKGPAEMQISNVEGDAIILAVAPAL